VLPVVNQHVAEGSSVAGNVEQLGEVGRSICVPYVLCRFPSDIQCLLDAGYPALAFDFGYRRRIRKALCDDLAQYTL
jgi:hypothetical protein